MARGGRRTGAGRKPKRMQVIPGGLDSTPNQTETATILPPPDGLTKEERAIWMQLAPLATERQTLNRSTALSFEVLCRNLVLELVMARDPDLVGGANHRGLLQRVDAELLRFDLSPNGKPHGAPSGREKPRSNLEKLKDRRTALHAVR